LKPRTEAAADDDRLLNLRSDLFEVLQILRGHHTADAFEVLPRPAEFIPLAATGDDEVVVEHRRAVGEFQFIVRCVNALDVVFFKVDPVFLPEKRFVGHQIFPAHMAHVGVHEGGTGEMKLSFGGN